METKHTHGPNRAITDLIEAAKHANDFFQTYAYELSSDFDFDAFTSIIERAEKRAPSLLSENKELKNAFENSESALVRTMEQFKILEEGEKYIRNEFHKQKAVNGDLTREQDELQNKFATQDLSRMSDALRIGILEEFNTELVQCLKGIINPSARMPSAKEIQALIAKCES